MIHTQQGDHLIGGVAAAKRELAKDASAGRVVRQGSDLVLELQGDLAAPIDESLKLGERVAPAIEIVHRPARVPVTLRLCFSSVAEGDARGLISGFTAADDLCQARESAVNLPELHASRRSGCA